MGNIVFENLHRGEEMDIVKILDDIGRWLSSPMFVTIVAVVFVVRVLYVVLRYISISDIAFSLTKRKAAKIELIERSNVSLRDKDTALYLRLRLTDNNRRPVAHRKVNLLLYKGDHPLSNSSYKGSTFSKTDKNGICEYCGITVFEQGVVNALIEVDNVRVYLDGIDLTSIIIKRNSIQNQAAGVFEKNPDKRIGFYNSKLDSILNKSADINKNKESYKMNKASYFIPNLFCLILIPIFLVSLIGIPVAAVLVIYLVDIIIFGVFTSDAKKKFKEAKVNGKNIRDLREALHKDIIYLYNEIYYDLSALVNDSEVFEKEPVDLQDKCSELARRVSLSDSARLSIY